MGLKSSCRRWTTGLVVVISSLIIMQGMAVAWAEFVDTPKGVWYENELTKLVSLKITSGYPDGTFRPDKPVTRAEFAKMLCLAMGWTTPTNINSSFKDITIASWQFPYAEAAKASAVMSGYPDGTFRPDHLITRAEVAKIVSGVVQLPTANGSLADIENSWAKSYINSCVKAGILKGYPGNVFKPSQSLTRAEAVKVISDIMDK